VLAAEACLAERVVVVRLALLGRIAVRVEQLQLPVRKRVPELAELVRVLRGEPSVRA
jgi:hypothetical protein